MRKILSLILGLLWTLPAFAALPDGYTQLEYIESTGTQYIDTGVAPNQDSRMTIDVLAPALGSGVFSFGGSFNQAWRPGFGVYGGNTTYKASLVYNNSDTAFEPNTQLQANVRYVFDLNKNVSTLQANGSTIASFTVNAETFSLTSSIELFRVNIAEPRYGKFRLYSAKIYNNGTLVRDFVPAKNASGVVGMYDTVTRTFFANAGTGEFIAGPDACRNLFDGQWRLGLYNTTTGAPTEAQKRISNRNMISIKPNTQYTVSSVSAASSINALRWLFYDENKNFISFINQGTTITSPENARYLNFYIANDFTLSNAPSDVQIEEGTTATAYVPYCSSSIKIATTKYNESAFGPLNTALANAISVVDSVVSNTITQAGRIATLQAQKQTRPNDIADDSEKCPAGIKCLLVEDANGTPHWYAIQESYLPLGYTPLEYIESTGTQYINTNYTWTSANHKVVAKISNVVSGGNQWLWGSYTNDANIRPGTIAITSADKLSVGVGNVGTASNTYTIDVPTTPTTLTLEVKDDNTFSLLGGSTNYTDVSVSGTFITRIPEYIFAGNQQGAASYSSQYKLYSLQMYDNNTLVRDFIPAKDSSGKIGMYDTVSGTFFENAGTGEFTAGPVAE